jgi:hypothetical protein
VRSTLKPYTLPCARCHCRMSCRQLRRLSVEVSCSRVAAAAAAACVLGGASEPTRIRCANFADVLRCRAGRYVALRNIDIIVQRYPDLLANEVKVRSAPLSYIWRALPSCTAKRPRLIPWKQ